MAPTDPPEPFIIIHGRRSGMSAMSALINGALREFTDALSLGPWWNESFSSNEIRVLHKVLQPPAKHKKKPKRRRRRNNPRPNRRRKAQKLRAAKQRPTWYQHITDGDEGHE
jgi:hypothetical protein